MTQSASIAKLATALFKAQREIKGAIKDSTNPFFKANYADLESVWQSIREPLYLNELSIVQPTGIIEGHFGVITVLLHSSGEYIQGFTPVHSKDNSPQAMGSGISYSRRYALASMLGVYQVDDDSEAAEGRNNAAAKSESKQENLQSKVQATAQKAQKTTEKAPGEAKSFKGDPNKVGISEAQQKRLYAIGVTTSGYEWVNLCRMIAERYGVKDFLQFKQKDYQEFCEWLEKNPNIPETFIDEEQIPF